MKVDELLSYFISKNPMVEAAAYLGVHPNTIRAWEKTTGYVPEQWAALFNDKKAKEAK